MRKILIIHGPNLNLLGERDPTHYGKVTLNALNEMLLEYAKEKSLELGIFQSNSEGEIIDFLQANRSWCDGIVINPAAYTHYSYAIRDAIEAVGKPTVEVHLSDIHAREPFRQISVTAEVCIDQIMGHGARSYLLGIDRLLQEIP